MFHQRNEQNMVIDKLDYIRERLIDIYSFQVVSNLTRHAEDLLEIGKA